eukprot:5955293-Lingulodinium_polyedra.AAC.1
MSGSTRWTSPARRAYWRSLNSRKSSAEPSSKTPLRRGDGRNCSRCRPRARGGVDFPKPTGLCTNIEE